MKSTIIATSFLLALQSVHGTPIVKRADPTVTQILQYALTLEHLESAFYTKGLAELDEAAFEKAGYPSWVRGRFVQIGQHEATHVAFLTSALGNNSVAACNYTFPFTDPKSFAALSLALEGVGTSAYLGAAQFLVSEPSVLTAAGAILTTEARHDSWVASAVLQGAPWSGSLDTPLDQNEVFTLASAFITSCPSSNPVLPFKAFPTLTVTGTPTPGKSLTLSYNSTGSGTDFLALFTGLSTKFLNISSSKEVTLPEGLQGVVYAIVTSNGTAVTDDSTIAGPAILNFPFDSNASNP